MKLSPKHRPKIDKLRVKATKGYLWELASIVFDKEEPRKKTSLSTHKLFYIFL